ncbi:motility associated factor glycosyltransferase family protein [Lysinibacillus sp. NPDC097231]|uniref:motility associated factor glycosyltransferase family protein n=1 Tax=Lysinibacillus sp. NPDC097231 TaxID=3364142 RepID=UPI00380AB5D3
MMNWSLTSAKNGEPTLQLNGVSIYSNYRPIEDAKRWITSECDMKSNEFLLIGLGLGYHLKALAETVKGKRITVYYFDKKELEIFYSKNKNVTWWQQEHIQITNILNDFPIHADIQVLLPNVWLRAIGDGHPLFNILDIIKNNQMTYKKNSELMAINFKENMKLDDDGRYPAPTRKVACLVAAGPSLDETIHWLKDQQEYVDIYVVGAVLKKLVEHNIVPTATVISDANDSIAKQLFNVKYNGPLYYLSTANHRAVKSHSGKRYILFQQGYRLAEKVAKEKLCPIIETGGSVGTSTFSLLELLGYQTIILFGQDLGFVGNQSHATLSVSRELNNSNRVREVLANNGRIINTTSNLYAFLHWYNVKMKSVKVDVYNTAESGAKINFTSVIDRNDFFEIVKTSMLCREN